MDLPYEIVVMIARAASRYFRAGEDGDGHKKRNAFRRQATIWQTMRSMSNGPGYKLYRSRSWALWGVKMSSTTIHSPSFYWLGVLIALSVRFMGLRT